jgi:hypothetical protein
MTKTYITLTHAMADFPPCADGATLAEACTAVAQALTKEQVDQAYAEALAMGLVPESTKKRRYVARAMAKLATMAQQSAANAIPRMQLRSMASRHGVVVGNTRAKAHFVRTLEAAALLAA